MDTRRLKILIVEDDMFMVRVLKMKLEQGGFEVYTAQNGAEGFIMADRLKPDVIISDVTMPQVDGLSMCTKISQSEDLRPGLFIVITSLIERHVRHQAEQLENACFVPKPVSPKNIVGIIRKHFDDRDHSTEKQ